MAASLTTILSEVDTLAKDIQAEYERLRSRVLTLEEENRQLRNELAQTQKDLEATRVDMEYLTMSHRLAESPDTIVLARRRIARLIRTIDKCVSMLKEE